MAVFQLSLEEKQAKVAKIAEYSPEVLRLAKWRELVEMCKGVVPKYGKMNSRDEMINALLEVTKYTREQKRLEQEKMIEVADSVVNARVSEGAIDLEQSRPQNLGKKLYQSIKEAVIDFKNRCVFEDEFPVYMGALAAKTAMKELVNYPKISTRKSRKTEYLQAMHGMAQLDSDCDYSDTIKRCLESFDKTMDSITRAEVTDYDRDYKRRTLEKAQNQQEVDGARLVEWAIEVLFNRESYKWSSVARALFLATGRRPSEIHCTATFTPIERNLVSFTGQLKAVYHKKDAEELEAVIRKPLLIPTLVPSYLVVSGLEYLTEKNRRYPLDYSDIKGSTDATDKKVSKELSRACNDPHVAQGLTAKDLRAIYGHLCWLVWGANSNENAYLTRILGHQNEAGTAAMSYARFSVADGNVAELKHLVLGTSA